MNSNEFWELIDHAKERANGDSRKQAAILTTVLAGSSVDSIIGFETFLSDLLGQAYDARLMAASTVLIEDMDDDDFMDFRLWLILRGRLVYDQSLANPDMLASIVSQNECVKASEMRYVAHEAYRKKTGRDGFDCVYAAPQSPELKNGSFVWQTKDGYADVSRLRVLFPQLWEKFGEHLGSG